MRVLVVEDEITLNKLISQKLKTQGYSVDSCFGGSLALDYLLVTEYDVVLLDILLSKLTGLQVLETM